MSRQPSHRSNPAPAPPVDTALTRTAPRLLPRPVCQPTRAASGDSEPGNSARRSAGPGAFVGPSLRRRLFSGLSRRTSGGGRFIVGGAGCPVTGRVVDSRMRGRHQRNLRAAARPVDLSDGRRPENRDFDRTSGRRQGDSSRNRMSRRLVAEQLWAPLLAPSRVAEKVRRSARAWAAPPARAPLPRHAASPSAPERDRGSFPSGRPVSDHGAATVAGAKSGQRSKRRRAERPDFRRGQVFSKGKGGGHLRFSGSARQRRFGIPPALWATNAST